jgi:nitroreductase
MQSTNAAPCAFQTTSVTEHLLMKLLNATIQAPSARNSQPWAFVIVDGKSLLREYSDRAERFLLGSLDPESPLHEYKHTMLGSGLSSRRGLHPVPSQSCGESTRMNAHLPHGSIE